MSGMTRGKTKGVQRDLKRLREDLMKRLPRYGGIEDDVQETLLAVWQRGAEWHEGRIVLELRNRIRMRRRKEKTRADINVEMTEDIERWL